MFYITISSKSKETLKLFLTFLSNYNNLIIKYFPKQKIKKFVTVLKSPHVNKSAQEQFEFRVYTKKLFVSSEQSFKFLYFLKKVQNNIFPLLSIKVESFLYEKDKQFKYKLKRLNPDKINIKFFNDVQKQTRMFKSLKLSKYIDLLDCYGEFNVKKLNK